MDAAAIFFYNTLYCENIVEEKPQTSSYEKYVLVENDQFDDYDEDEELRRAIEESLKMSS